MHPHNRQRCSLLTLIYPRSQGWENQVPSREVQSCARNSADQPTPPRLELSVVRQQLSLVLYFPGLVVLALAMSSKPSSMGVINSRLHYPLATIALLLVYLVKEHLVCALH